MKQATLLRKIARLESMNDQLVTELRYIDQLARSLGFAQGLITLKSAALEMLRIDTKKDVQEDVKEDVKEDEPVEEGDY